MYTLEVLNITKYIEYPIKDLELLGRGTQGSVYKIDEHKKLVNKDFSLQYSLVL